MGEVPGDKKAAMLLLMLGEEQAAKVLKFVDPADVEKIGTAMAAMGDVDNEKAELLVDDFHSALASESSIGVSAPGYVRKILTSSLGEDTGTTLADKLLGSEETLELGALRWREPEVLMEMLKDEHPQIIAITLAHLDQEQAGQVLKCFKPEVQEGLVLRIANMNKIPQAAIRQLQSVLQKKLSLTGSLKNNVLDGAMAAANIMNALDSESEARILENIAKTNEPLSVRIQDLMFVFDNLIKLGDKEIQLLLREVGSDTLPVALKGANDALTNKLLGNMSKRAKEMLLEDMEARGPIKLSEVEAAQKEILVIVRKLAEGGQIELSSGGDEYV